jgi:fluoride ion exporter CrcB/FEX
MIQKLALLALAGGVGTLARYGIAGFVQRIHGTSFPWGTLSVNLTGCFLAGLLFTLFENRWAVSGYDYRRRSDRAREGSCYRLPAQPENGRVIRIHKRG